MMQGEPIDYEVDDLITLADEKDHPEDDLLGPRGEGFLRRGGGMFIVGPTNCGKSSLSVQLGICWSCGHKVAVIPSTKPLRVLIIQSEDDRQDAREMARVYKRLKLTKEEIVIVKQNTRFIRWRGAGPRRITEDENGRPKVEETQVSEQLIELLEQEIQRGGPVDIIIVNPLSAYTEEGIMSQKSNRAFLYGLIDSFLDRNNCAIVFLHHTPKFRDEKRAESHSAQLYGGSGDATFANWPRASLFIWPTATKGVFEFRPGQTWRATRLGNAQQGL
jgi:RecA-family ATPase